MSLGGGKYLISGKSLGLKVDSVQWSLLRFTPTQLQQFFGGNRPILVWYQHTKVHLRSAERSAQFFFGPSLAPTNRPAGEERQTSRRRTAEIEGA